VAGSVTTGVTVEELKTIARGWSATKQILGKPVYNDKNERVGEVDDLIIAPDSSISYAIIGVGGFLGLGERQVAVPVNRFKHTEGRIVLPDATKDALQAMPSFQYAQ
jgi:sporulation protein YlmC with PRC-barrel domain